MYVYLIVLEADKTSVTDASFNQIHAQRLCHAYKKATGIAHAVVTELACVVLTPSLLKQLKKKSPRFASECIVNGF